MSCFQQEQSGSCETSRAVAQLGERRVRDAKVGSSILLGSTNYEVLGRIPIFRINASKFQVH